MKFRTPAERFSRGPHVRGEYLTLPLCLRNGLPARLDKLLENLKTNVLEYVRFS